MKRFQFRLERLLRVKRQKDRLAETRQVQARQALETARGEVDLLVGRLLETGAAVEARIGKTIETDFWVAHCQHMTGIRLAIDAAEATAARASAALENANRLRRKTSTEVDALRLLREQQWQEHKQRSASEAQQRLDEIYVRRGLGQAVPDANLSSPNSS